MMSGQGIQNWFMTGDKNEPDNADPIILSASFNSSKVASALLSRTPTAQLLPRDRDYLLEGSNSGLPKHAKDTL